jgi:hypothetical protein
MPPGKQPVRRRSTLDVDFAMDKQPPPAPGGVFNVVIIGAGGINFGSIEGGPWNHSFRLEHKVISFVGLTQVAWAPIEGRGPH